MTSTPELKVLDDQMSTIDSKNLAGELLRKAIEICDHHFQKTYNNPKWVAAEDRRRKERYVLSRIPHDQVTTIAFNWKNDNGADAIADLIPLDEGGLMIESNDPDEITLNAI